MKYFLLLTILSFGALASPLSIIPDRLVTPLVDVFSSGHKELSSQLMEVKISTYANSGSIQKGRATFEMAREDFLLAQKQSRAVFEMVPDQNASSTEDGFIYMGTAFHIGENLVLTNQHVLSPNRSNSTKCDGFVLRGNENNDSYSCKKVHYCDVKEDFCLIEMEPAKRCLNLFCTKSKTVELKDGEALKLNPNPKVKFTEMDKVVMSCIGNTMGYGIHFSQGRGIQITKDKTYFFAPLRTGNSGGPLIGEDGLVWGVVKQESEIKVSNESYNVAAPIDHVIKILRKNLSDDKDTLRKFNLSVAE